MRARLLRWASETNASLSTNFQHTFAARHALLHWPSGAVATFIPKNACSTLRLSLAVANGVSPMLLSMPGFTRTIRRSLHLIATLSRPRTASSFCETHLKG